MIPRFCISEPAEDHDIGKGRCQDKIQSRRGLNNCARHEVVVMLSTLPRGNGKHCSIGLSGACKCYESRVYLAMARGKRAPKRHHCCVPRKRSAEAAWRAPRGRALWKRGKRRESACNPTADLFRSLHMRSVEEGKKTRERLQQAFTLPFAQISFLWKRGKRRESACNRFQPSWLAAQQ